MTQAPTIFDRNMQALRRTDPAFAERLSETAAAEVEWFASTSGPLSAEVAHEGRPLALASRYDPLTEAGRLVADIDHEKTACVVLLGMGLGYHVVEVARRMEQGASSGGRGGGGLLIVYEPNIALLRAVLERIDHSAWLGLPRTIIVDEEVDRAALIARVERHAGTVLQGTRLIGHPPTRRRHPERCRRFSQMVAETLAYCRTQVATAMVNSTRTCSNLTSNLARYAAGPTTDELFEAAKGFPAVCVGAGPSLARNVALLRDPAVRRNVVLISVQTTLKPLLARGIRPDFVTALDYSAISQRFYEDLPDLPDVTLVAEPQAHPTVLDSFPGPIRTTRSPFNDCLLGGLAPPRRPLRGGASVAHLSFYLAQHLGCEPIILIGQDLGFSDGLYYAPGTAAHDVWAGELNAFNTLEMMEWRRIVRHKSHLQRMEDVNGRPIFSDEQMLTYLRQFERDFAEAPQTVIDATEGGAPKADTTRMPLAEAVGWYATRPTPRLPHPAEELDARRLAQLAALLDRRHAEVQDLRWTTAKTTQILEKMAGRGEDQVRMKKLAARLEPLRRHVAEDLSEAFSLVNALNVTGVFKRKRSDRAIFHQSKDALNRQQRQIERDLDNLRWLIQACDEMLRSLDAARCRVKTMLQREQPRHPSAAA